MTTENPAADAIPNDTPVLFVTETRQRPSRGHVRGTVTEPDGSLTYRIYDPKSDRIRHITADLVRPLYNRRRGK